MTNAHVNNFNEGFATIGIPEFLLHYIKQLNLFWMGKGCNFTQSFLMLYKSKENMCIK